MRQIAPAEPIVFVLNYAEYVNRSGNIEKTYRCKNANTPEFDEAKAIAETARIMNSPDTIFSNLTGLLVW